MGPIALYDKSFLEGLNVNEAVLFDHFFYPVICPIFYVETLADLEKATREGRSPEQVVGSLSFKSPEMHGGPNVHHHTLVSANLMGMEIQMTGQIVVAGGRRIRNGDRNGVVFKQMPEYAAFTRWQRGQFLDLERSFAKAWREALKVTNLHDFAEQANRYGIDLGECKTLENAHNLAINVIDQLPATSQIEFAIEHFNFTAQNRCRILDAWKMAGEQNLRLYAPYAHFVLVVDVFFQIALASGKISKDRPSNLNDVAYLYYLPFCLVFLSSDRLHRECAPLFMREEQEFIWGIDMKCALAENHDHYFTTLSEEQKRDGLIRLGLRPIPGLIEDVYTRQFGLRNRSHRSRPIIDPGSSAVLGEYIASIQNAPAIDPDEIAEDEVDFDSVTIERMVLKSRGSWFQIPADTKQSEE